MDKKSSNLETFISLIQERLDACAPVTEDDIVRCIYVMLGRKARFNPEYTHEGTYKRIQIYKQSMQKGRLQSIIQEDEWIVICTDLANLAEYLGNRFGVDIKAIKSNDDNEYSHMKNRVTRKDGTTYDFDSPYEKVKFLIENISPYSNEDLKGYNEQKFHHIEVIEEVLGKQNDLWSFLDCYTFHIKRGRQTIN